MMRINYLHASKYGNGRTVADEFARQMQDRGAVVEVHHIREVDPATLPPADLYVFSSPGRFGKPIRSMRRFLAKVQLPAGTRYAIFTTEMQPKPDEATGEAPSEDELVRRGQRVRPIMNEILEGKGLVEVAEGVTHVAAMRGPLEDGWQHQVEAFASALPTGATA